MACNVDDLINSLKIYQTLTGGDFSQFDTDVANSGLAVHPVADILTPFINNMTTVAQNATPKQLNELFSMFNFVGMIQKQYSGSTETDLLENLFSAAYKTQASDTAYTQTNNLEQDTHWYETKTTTIINDIKKGKYSSVEEARAAIMSVFGYDAAALIKDFRNTSFSNSNQEKYLPVLLAIVTGGTTDIYPLVQQINA